MTADGLRFYCKLDRRLDDGKVLRVIRRENISCSPTTLGSTRPCTQKPLWFQCLFANPTMLRGSSIFLSRYPSEGTTILSTLLKPTNQFRSVAPSHCPSGFVSTQNYSSVPIVGGDSGSDIHTDATMLPRRCRQSVPFTTGVVFTVTTEASGTFLLSLPVFL